MRRRWPGPGVPRNSRARGSAGPPRCWSRLEPRASGSSSSIRSRARAMRRAARSAPSWPRLPLPTSRSSHGLGTDGLTWTGAPVPVALRPGYEGGGESRSPEAFVLTDLDGRALLEGRVETAHVAAARDTIRDRTLAALIGLTALFLAWLSVALLAWGRAARAPAATAMRVAVLVGVVAAARAAAWIAVPLVGAVAPLSRVDSVPPLAMLWLRSPADFLLSSMACLAGVILAGDVVTRLRLGLRRARVSPAATWTGAATFALANLAAGTAAAAMLAWYLGLGNALSALTGIDWLRYSLHPWDGARLEVAAGLIAMHATALWGAVTIFRFAAAWWRVRSASMAEAGLRRGLGPAGRALGLAARGAERVVPVVGPVAAVRAGDRARVGRLPAASLAPALLAGGVAGGDVSRAGPAGGDVLPGGGRPGGQDPAPGRRDPTGAAGHPPARRRAGHRQAGDEPGGRRYRAWPISSCRSRRRRPGRSRRSTPSWCGRRPTWPRTA